MHRIDAPGATVGNLFTEGNPSLSIPATEVSDDWLNDVQEEIANVIEDQGITLVKGTQDQLLTALQTLVGAGGVNYKLDPLANNTAAQSIPSLSFDSADHQAAVIPYSVHRQTATQNVQEMGLLLLSYDIADAAWRLEKTVFGHDNAGCTFTVTAGGQIQVGTSDLTGASYAGQCRVSGVMRMAL